jgi:hypothetical protein
MKESFSLVLLFLFINQAILALDNPMVAVSGGTLQSSNSYMSGSTITPFLIRKYETTWGEWMQTREWAVANGYQDLEGIGQGIHFSHPVTEVSWYDVIAWCNAKSEMEGLEPVYWTTYFGGYEPFRSGYRELINYGFQIQNWQIEQRWNADGYRLPNESEWEWAAQGGALGNGFTFSGSNDINAVAWYYENSTGSTRPVGYKLPNELDIFDMTGNVREWCFGVNYNTYPLPVNSDNRALRGGGWDSSILECNLNYYYDFPAHSSSNSTGFRLVRKADPPPVIILRYIWDSEDGRYVPITANATVGQAFEYIINATNNPTSYDAIGLPQGLSLNSTTGLISGIPTSIGNYSLEISATNVSGTGNSTLLIRVNPTAPVITSALTSNGTERSEFSYQISASNNATSYNATGLPSGLSINTSTGLISGVPSWAGNTNVTISATNAGGTGSANLSIIISPILVPPVIFGGGENYGVVGIPYSGGISVFSKTPYSLYASGLPPGLTIGPSGIIYGTPYYPGYYQAQISATNDAGTASIWISFQIAPPPAPLVTGGQVNAKVGDTFSYQIQAQSSFGTPTFAALGLPAGLSLDSNTGLISGTPISAGNYTVGITATTFMGGTGGANLLIIVSSANPVITSLLSAESTIGVPFNYQITATNNPTSFGATGLPPGLSLNSTTGLISGIPTTAGSSSVVISANNSAGSGSATLTINASQPAPVITSATTVNATVGVAFNYQITATNSPTSFGASGLPSGLTLNSTTGLISGTPTTAGNSTVTISATNARGTGTAILFISVKPPAPVITSATTVNATVGVAFNYQITATNNPTSFGASGLPAGLSFNSTTGLISGIPTATGNASVTISATNAGGTGLATLLIFVRPPAPVITSATSANGTVGEVFSYVITATNNPTSFGATGLPLGLSVDSTTGIIGGSPTAPGNSSITIFATNAGGTGSATLSLVVNPRPPKLAFGVGAPLGNFTSVVGSPSESQAIEVLGSDLIEYVTVTAPLGFEVSLGRNMTFSSNAQIAHMSGNVSAILYVRISSSVDAGPVSGNISISSSGAESQSLFADGRVLTQYEAGYRDGFQAGINHVLSNPSTYNLYTSEQYNNSRFAGQTDVTSSPSDFGLHTTASIMDMNLGGVMLQHTGGGNMTLRLQIQSTPDLSSQPFQNYGNPIEIPVQMSGAKGFLRVRALGPNNAD